MKICTPSIILIVLILIFFIFNSIFFFRYLFNIKQHLENRAKKHYEMTESEFLKHYVDFNNTTYKNRGIVYFYYSLRGVDLNQGGWKNDVLNERNKKGQRCDYFYDKNEDLFVDIYGNLCRDEAFDFADSYCCLKHNDSDISINSNCNTDLNENSENSNSNNTSVCCKSEGICVYSCLINTKKNYPGEKIENFKNCRNNCKLKYSTLSFPEPHCFNIQQDN